MVPMRAAFNWFGLPVQFWPEAGALEGRNSSGKTIDMWLGNTQARIDDRLVRLAAAPREINGTVYVPIAVVARAMGASVSWNETTKTVTMYWSGRTGVLHVGQRGIHGAGCG
jgi:hypothetical protein